MNEPKEIKIVIVCYFCGEPMYIPFPLFDGKAEYTYCLSCKEGVEIVYRGDTLYISRLVEEH